MVNIDEIAAQALMNSETLTSMLANGADSVYHDNAPEDGEYPIVQYTDVTEVPVLHADNNVVAFQKIIRVTIINNTPVNRSVLKEKVINAMVSAGFSWQSANTVKSDREYYTAIDFSYGALFDK